MSHVGPLPGPDDDTESRPRAGMTSITGWTHEYFAIIIIEFEQVSNYGPQVVRVIPRNERHGLTRSINCLV